MDASVIEERLAALENEYTSGQRLLAESEARAARVREQLLRISGAMRVLSELLGKPEAGVGAPAGSERASADL